MAIHLEALVPEALEHVVDLSNLDALLATRLASHAWRRRVQHASEVWKTCCTRYFGSREFPAAPDCWMGVFTSAKRAQRAMLDTWSTGSLRQGSVFVFSRYVRSWASDEKTLVAGLNDGRLQPLDWASHRVGEPFAERHSDEVTCIDVNGDYVLSGSGDPGYYRRQPTDSSVKLWRRRDGELLGSSGHHQDSVRGVALFPASSPLSNYAVSAGLDARACLMSLDPFQSISSVVLLGPCRSMQVVPPAHADTRPAQVSEMRLIAGAGDGLMELLVKASPPDAPSLSVLRSISLSVLRGLSMSPSCLTSGLTYHIHPQLWERTPAGEAYPPSLLDDPGFVVAGGTVDGQVWICKGQPQRPLTLHRPLTAAFADRVPTVEVVSAELLGQRWMLAMSRCGVLWLVEWDFANSSSAVLWAVKGFRMYVSTMRRREPLLLVSDGFDNAVRTLRAVPEGASESEANDEDSSQ